MKYDENHFQLDFSQAWTWNSFSKVYGTIFHDFAPKGLKLVKKALLTRKPVKINLATREWVESFFNKLAESDADLLRKFGTVLEISPSLPVKTVAKMMGITEESFVAHLPEWQKTIPFSLTNGILEVHLKEDFMAALQKEFDEWNSRETDHSSKIDKINGI